jgi:hypothetical protein
MIVASFARFNFTILITETRAKLWIAKSIPLKNTLMVNPARTPIFKLSKLL